MIDVNNFSLIALRKRLLVPQAPLVPQPHVRIAEEHVEFWKHVLAVRKHGRILVTHMEVSKFPWPSHQR